MQVGEPGHAVVGDVGEPKLRGPQDAIVKVTAEAYRLFDSRTATKVVLLP